MVCMLVRAKRGILIVRDETWLKGISPELRRAYMVGRDTPRNSAASVMERYCFGSVCFVFPIFCVVCW